MGYMMENEPAEPDGAVPTWVVTLHWLTERTFFFLTSILTALLLVFLGFQVYMIYWPAARLAVDPTYKPEYPAYVYEVWGKDFDGLNYAEPWVLLGVSVFVSACSIKFVLLASPEAI